MPDYTLLSYQAGQGPRAGMAVDGAVYDVAKIADARYERVIDVLEDWDAAQGRLEAAAAKAAGGTPLAQARLLAPVLYPSAIFCAGANYSDHVAEMDRAQNRTPDPNPHDVGLKPWHFLKASRVVVGPGTAVPLPKGAQRVDWEVELTAVIGRRAKDVPIERALEYVAGYTIANDVSARDLGQRPPLPKESPFFFDWVAHKSFDASCPIGPWIVPAKQLPDPQNLGIKLWVNGTIKQDSHTSKMIFTLAEQIAQISSRTTLYPGDLVLTGTPAGVGAGRNEFLKSGDTVKLWCERLGEFSHTMV
jgi:2-keto-4-pentenoate hydratase/2-oxohepta-3-ene-1,7-dioic acid hydratase in catechol pathway